MQKYFRTWKQDLPAGIVVFLVALPLCLGIALASGAPFFSGMIAGIVGGLVVASISNSQLSVSGPAAGLAAIVLVSIQQLGAFNVFLLAVVLAGIMQVVLGFLKAGTISNYFPSNVIKGMLTAIGILIILKQIPHAFGYDADIEGNLDFIQANGENTFTALLHPLQHINLGATLIAVTALAILILWEKPFIKNRAGFIPGGLVAVIVSIVLNELFVTTGSSLAITEKSHLVNVPIANGLNEFLGFFTFPDFSQITNVKVITIAATIAVVASIETLLSIEAVDNIDPHKRVTSTNLELKAQGIGNIVSGLIGGLPITSVIVRSSANVNAKAETKVSAMFHSFLLLVCVALIPTLLNKIPLAALAAILLTVGYKLTKISIYKEMFQNGKHQWVPFIVTVLVVVFTDLLKGVGVGLAVSIFYILKGNLKNAYFFHKEDYHAGDKIRIQLAEEVSFLNKASIKQTLAHLPENSVVTIDASKTTYIDYDVLELIRNFREVQAKEKNITPILIGFKEEYKIENDIHVQSIHELK
ncbi:MAG: SulP family inorganic anion transporter [Sphingobacteriales bacterium]|nr:SulP family inorganic anion transporter [Sphingobacteriales bacterium]